MQRANRMIAIQIYAVLDAHDALVRDCAAGRLTFGEFLGAYGEFPRGYGLEEGENAEESGVLRLLRKRLAFHRQVAGVISGIGETAKLGSVEYNGVGEFLPAVGLIRLRELVARSPTLEATG
jgi:hypothetical protein